MSVKEVTRYEAEDGELFETRREAEAHNSIYGIEVALRSLPSRLGFEANRENAAALYRVGLRHIAQVTVASD